MKNPIVMKIFAVISFIISGIFTIMLMTSGTVGLIPCLLTAGMAVCLEVAKCGFAYTAIANDSINLVIRVIMGVVAICLVVSSIFASAGFVQNQSNEVKNITIENSTAFQNGQENRKIQQDLYSQKKKEIEQMQLDKQKTIEDMTRSRDNLPKNYITAKQNATAEITKKDAEYQSNINSKSAELSQITKNLQEPVNLSGTLNTGGYSALFQTFSGWLNKSAASKKDPWTPEQVEFIFFITLSILFEITAVLFSFMAQIKTVATSTATEVRTPDQVKKSYQLGKLKNTLSRNNKYGGDWHKVEPEKIEKPDLKIVKTEPTTAQAELPRKIGFDTNPEPLINTDVQPKSFTNKDVEEYLNYMYEESDGVESVGYTKLGRNTTLGIDKARKVKAHLEYSSVLATQGNKTLILKPKDEAVKMLNLVQA